MQTLSSAASPGQPTPIQDLVLVALPDPQVTGRSMQTILTTLKQGYFIQTWDNLLENIEGSVLAKTNGTDLVLSYGNVYYH